MPGQARESARFQKNMTWFCKKLDISDDTRKDAGARKSPERHKQVFSR
jgi:hypothetical protein